MGGAGTLSQKQGNGAAVSDEPALTAGPEGRASFQQAGAPGSIADFLGGSRRQSSSMPHATPQTLNPAQELAKKWVHAFREDTTSTPDERKAVRKKEVHPIFDGLHTKLRTTQDSQDFVDYVFNETGVLPLEYANCCMSRDSYPQKSCDEFRRNFGALIYGRAVTEKAKNGITAVNGIQGQAQAGRDPKKNAVQGFLDIFDAPDQQRLLEACIDDVCMRERTSLAQALKPTTENEAAHRYYANARNLADDVINILDGRDAEAGNDKAHKLSRIQAALDSMSMKDRDAFRRAAVLAYNESDGARNLVLEIRALQN